MNNGQGAFIVIEGTDGSGKGTQFELLAKRLEKEGYEVATFDFPQYEKPSSYFVTEYLNGKYGSADEVGPYVGSIFYALDRFEAGPKIREALTEGKIILANRYVGSNMAHQGTKFAYPEERRGYFIWLDNLEFEMFKIPRPTLSFVLRVPAKTAYKLVGKKGKRGYTDKKRDIHEKDINHLEKSVEVYDDLCQLFPKDFVRIDCTRDDELLDIETINDILWQKIEPLLPSRDSNESVASDTPEAEIVTPDEPKDETSLENYFIPALPEKLQKQYREIIDEIIAERAKISLALEKFLEDYDHVEAVDTATPLRALQPIATIECQLPEHNSALAKISQELLPTNYADCSTQIKLSNASPRNEFDILPSLLYSQTDLSFVDLKAATSSWSYDKKIEIMESYLENKPGHVLNKVTYSWDMFTDFATYLDFAAHGQDVAKMQTITPRYGFDVPEIIEKAGLTDDYEKCFALSLKLHSLLHSNNRLSQAQYAALLGNKVRWQLNLSGKQIASILTSELSQKYSQIITEIKDTVTDKHPNIAETFKTQELRHL